MAKYKKIQLNMREDNLEKIIFAYLSDYAPSRASAAKKCSVSTVTSGKVASALLESGFMVERIFSKDGDRPCAHLFFRASANILVIDMSSSVFKMTIADAYGDVKFRAEYEYDSSLFPDENISIFLSRCGTAARSSNRAFCAISVIYFDGASVQYGDVNIPHISDKERISLAIYEIFNKRPMLHITVSEAVSCAMKLNVHGEVTGGISYIFIGDHISLFHVFQNGSVTVCNPRTIISGYENTAVLLNDRHMTKDKADLLFLYLSSFMGSAFSPFALLLESDRFLPDEETCSMIMRKFLLSGQNPPLIYEKTNKYPLCLIGAVRATLLKTLRRYITVK